MEPAPRSNDDAEELARGSHFLLRRAAWGAGLDLDRLSPVN
jgi:hypothetical protein